jgi:hypothetical protein
LPPQSVEDQLSGIKKERERKRDVVANFEKCNRRG